MSEKDEEKKVVFKVKFSNPGNTEVNQAEPRMVTEWNFMRIAMAGVALLILITVGINLFQGEDESVDTVNIAQEEQIEKANTDITTLVAKSTESVVSKVKKQQTTLSDKKQTYPETSAQVSGGLIRAQLAKGIWENEPFGKITSPIKVNDEEATGIFYFTELDGMKGKTIFHIWKYKGDVIFKKQRDIQDNNWKTYTSKLFTKRSIGSWSVETIDSENRQLNIIYFDVASVN